MNSSQQTHSEAEDQIDIIALLSKVWAGRKFVIKSAVISACYWCYGSHINP